jgi:hypothetical protein
VSFFGRGETYRLFGLIPADRHLFTTKQGAYPVFLLGADHLGRDLFSRIVYGSRTGKKDRSEALKKRRYGLIVEICRS